MKEISTFSLKYKKGQREKTMNIQVTKENGRETYSLTQDQMDALVANPEYDKQLPKGLKVDVERRRGKKAVKVQGIQDPETPNADEKGDVDILALNVPEAVEVIEKTNDVDLLESWLDQDDRKGVQTAINDRLEQLLQD